METKSPAETMQALSNASKHKAETPWLNIIFLAMMAGGAIAIGDIFWAHSVVEVGAKLAPGIANIIGGFAFSTGLMLVVFFGGHLFTSSVLTGMTVAERKMSVFKGILVYWPGVWIFNFVGSILIAYLYFKSGLPFKYHEWIAKHFVIIGAAKCSLSFGEAFIRGIFCNILVCMAVWMAVASRDAAGKIFAIAFPIAAFVAAGYEHCVANMFIITEALLCKIHYLAQVGGDLNSLADILHHYPVTKLANLNIQNFLIKNQIPVTLGNIVGGVVFVGLVGLLSHKHDVKQ